MAKFKFTYDQVRVVKEAVFETIIEADDEEHAKKIFSGLGPSAQTKKISDIYGGQSTRYDVRKIEEA